MTTKMKPSLGVGDDATATAVGDAVDALDQAGNAILIGMSMSDSIKALTDTLINEFSQGPRHYAILEAIHACAEKLGAAVREAENPVSVAMCGLMPLRKATSAVVPQSQQLDERAAKAAGRRFSATPEPITGFGPLATVGRAAEEEVQA